MLYSEVKWGIINQKNVELYIYCMYLNVSEGETGVIAYYCLKKPLSCIYLNITFLGDRSYSYYYPIGLLFKMY